MSNPAHPEPAQNNTPAQNYPGQGDPTAAPQQQPAPGYPASTLGYAVPAPAPATPGRGLAIAGLILAFFVPPLGLILSIVAAVKLGKAHAPKGIAIAGIIIGAILTIFWTIVIILFAIGIAAVLSTCADLGPGVWEVGGVTYTCS